MSIRAAAATAVLPSGVHGSLHDIWLVEWASDPFYFFSAATPRAPRARPVLWRGVLRVGVMVDANRERARCAMAVGPCAERTRGFFASGHACAFCLPTGPLSVLSVFGDAGEFTRRGIL